MFKKSLIAIAVLLSSTVSIANELYTKMPADQAKIINDAYANVGATNLSEAEWILGLDDAGSLGKVSNSMQFLIITSNDAEENTLLARRDNDGNIIVFSKEVSDLFFNAGDTSTPVTSSLEKKILGLTGDDNKSATTTAVANNTAVNKEAPKKETSSATGTSGIKNPYANFQPLPFTTKIRIKEGFEYKDVQYMLIGYDRDHNTRVFRMRDPYTGQEGNMACYGSVNVAGDNLMGMMIPMGAIPNEICHHFNQNRRDLRADFPVKDLPEPKNITKDTTWIPYYLDFTKDNAAKSYAIFHGRKVYFRNLVAVAGGEGNQLVLSYVEKPKTTDEQIYCDHTYGHNYVDDKIHPEDPITAEFCHQLHDIAIN
jgi:hypothetical protein|nr:MAG TPA: hypothetical protein [Bacteriophage sp.]